MFTPFAFMAEAAAAGYDPDAQAFFDAVEGGGDTLTTTEKDGTNQLVLDMKSLGVWSRLYAFYPLVGSTSTSCKWNLKDPRDLDAAFRLTYTAVGNLTFNTKGWKQDSSTDGGAFSQFKPSDFSATISANISMGMGIYDKGVLSGNGMYDMAMYDGSNENAVIGAGFQSSLNNSYFSLDNAFKSRALAGDEAESFWQLDRASDNPSNGILYRNGASWLASSTGQVFPNRAGGIGLGINNRSGYNYSSNRGYNCFFISQGLGATTSVSFNTAIQTWLTALGKQP